MKLLQKKKSSDPVKLMMSVFNNGCGSPQVDEETDGTNEVEEEKATVELITLKCV